MAAVGNQRDTARAGDIEEPCGSGQVGMGDQEVVEPLGDDPVDAVIHCAVQTQTGTPDDLRPAFTGPFGDLVVVTCHEGGHLGDHIDDA